MAIVEQRHLEQAQEFKKEFPALAQVAAPANAGDAVETFFNAEVPPLLALGETLLRERSFDALGRFVTGVQQTVQRSLAFLAGADRETVVVATVQFAVKKVVSGTPNKLDDLLLNPLIVSAVTKLVYQTVTKKFIGSGVLPQGNKDAKPVLPNLAPELNKQQEAARTAEQNKKDAQEALAEAKRERAERAQKDK